MAPIVIVIGIEIGDNQTLGKYRLKKLRVCKNLEIMIINEI